MILPIARRELQRQTISLTFWLALAMAQLITGWLLFAQLEVFATIAPQLIAARSSLGAMDLVITPTLNSLVVIILIISPLLTMSAVADERRSGRIALWLSAPVNVHQIVSGKLLGHWLASLLIIASCLLTIATLALGMELDWGRLAVATVLLFLLSLLATSLTLALSAFSQQPAAALTGSYGLLFGLWLLDSLSGHDSPWHWAALAPHMDAAFNGIVSSNDLIYFLLLSLAGIALANFQLARLRGDI